MMVLLHQLLLLLILKMGGITMAIIDVYVTLIIAGRRTFVQVPASLKPAVKTELEAMGLGTDGKPLETTN
ncbi:CD1375 family protein [Paenibacillus aurantiacus]|uniref:CD1375 family protein n=1 Tax=Paenibacillus aurantiacus TaxID=1936118 RepID=A0ABV5KP55_9BACL